MYDTTNDPFHHTKRRAVWPVTGTHEKRDGVLYLNGKACKVCRQATESQAAASVSAVRFYVGQLVQWTYGKDGVSHGQVIKTARTRVQVVRIKKSRTGKAPKAIWKQASKLRPEEKSE